MKRTKQLLAAVSSTALIALSVSPAYAVGTDAGEVITNSVSVDYQVGGFNQTAVTDTDDITVDRRINFTVVETGDGDTTVSPGESDAVLAFDITNLSNDTTDFELAIALPGTNDFTPTNVRYYLDNEVTGTVGSFDAGDQLITFLDEIVEDDTVRVFVVSDIPLNDDGAPPSGLTSGDEADAVLSATARQAGNANALGAAYVINNGANSAGVDTVFADAGNDGVESDTDTYVVAAADLTVVKTSTLISDPVNGTTNPKAIPGAVIEYCIAVSNAAGGATATSINVTDDLPSEVDYDAVFGIFVDGTVNGAGACQADGNAGGAYDAVEREVTGTLSDIAAGVTRTLYFRSTIQ